MTNLHPSAYEHDGVNKADAVAWAARGILTQWADEARRAGDLPASWATDTISDVASWCDPNAAFDLAAAECGAPFYGEGVSHDDEIGFLNTCVEVYEATFCMGEPTDHDGVAGSTAAVEWVRHLKVGALVIWDDGASTDQGEVVFRSDDGLVVRWDEGGKPFTRWHDWDTCADYLRPHS